MKSNLRIVIVNCVFYPEPVVSSKMGYDFALYLSSLGHRVDVICPIPSRPNSFDFSYYINLPKDAVNENFTIHRLNSYSNPASNLFGRFRESISFGLKSGKYIKDNFRDANVVYANTWPLFGQYLLAKVCKKLRIPLVFHIKDVYPESLLRKLNPLVSFIFSKPFFYIEREAMRMSQMVILLSDKTMRHYQMTRGLSENKIEKCLDWQNHGPFVDFSLQQEMSFFENLIDKKKFTFMYMGNIGPVAGVELLINSFERANLENSQLIIAGDGSRKDDCVAHVNKLGLINVIFISVPDGKVPDIQSFADILLLPVKTGEAYSSVPSKLISYLFSSKPVLASLDIDSDTSKFITNANAGWVVEPENIVSLSDKMIFVSKLSKEELSDIGKKGFEYGVKQFSMESGVKKLTELIIRAASIRR